MWPDSTYVKVRQNSSVVSMALVLAIGVREDGCEVAAAVRSVFAQPDIVAARDNSSSGWRSDWASTSSWAPC